MKLPTLFYRDGGTFQRPGGTFSTLAVNTPEQAVEAAKAGWFPSLPEALGQPAPAPVAPPVADPAGGAAMFDVSAMNRAQLIEAATFLGVKDAAKLKDGKLREAVKSAMAAQVPPTSTDGNSAGA